MLYSHLSDLGTWRSIKLWLVLMLFCWLNQKYVPVSLSEEKPHKLNSAYHCVNITRIMNSNKKQPNIGEEMVIYSQGAVPMYGLTGSLLMHAQTLCSASVSHTDLRLEQDVGWDRCFVSPVQTNDWSGRVSGSANQERTWSRASLWPDCYTVKTSGWSLCSAVWTIQDLLKCCGLISTTLL